MQKQMQVIVSIYSKLSFVYLAPEFTWIKECFSNIFNREGYQSV